jgi:hypothetical protein
MAGVTSVQNPTTGQVALQLQQTQAQQAQQAQPAHHHGHHGGNQAAQPADTGAAAPAIGNLKVGQNVDTKA